MKKIKLIILIITIFLFCGCENKSNNKITIVATNYPGYDFARAITKSSENIEVILLINPGSELHDYEPTPKDIIRIGESKLFIYVGGESDDWVNSLIKSNNIDKNKTFRLMDNTDVMYEEIVEGMEVSEKNEKEYDEHVWTSITSSIEILEKLESKIIEIDNKNKELYENNTKEYINELKEIDSEIREIVKNSKRKEIIFADRFPIRYFADDYNLKYYAAYPGCSHQTEASSKTIAFLIEKVKEDKIPVIFKLELSNSNIAETISKETNAKILEFNSAHNISKDDFDSGITYAQIMNKNKEVLKEALN